MENSVETIIAKILNKENMGGCEVVKATSGFTNLVYFVGDNVIKISTDDRTNKKLEKEISIYRNIQLDYIPKYISSGEIDGHKYLIITRVKGRGLYSIWHELTKAERINCVKKIANILKEFNSQSGDFLADEYRLLDWPKEVVDKFNKNKQGLSTLGIDTSKLTLDENIFENNKYGLVYNDAHFDNFLYDNGKLSLIDFDRVVYAPIDYEMLIFKSMCDNPPKFASEEDEDQVYPEEYEGIYEMFRNEYKEMFNIPNVDKRIKVYQFNYLCNQALTMKNREIGDNWARELVNEYIRG